MSKPPKPAPAKKPKAEKPEAAAKAKKPAKAKVVVEPVVVDAEAPVVKPVRVKPAAAAEDTALAKRLAEMTDFALRAYQQSTTRISRDPKHAKSASAKLTLASIETEMARRVASPGSAPSGVRVGVAKPKSEIVKGGKGRG